MQQNVQKIKTDFTAHPIIFKQKIHTSTEILVKPVYLPRDYNAPDDLRISYDYPVG